MKTFIDNTVTLWTTSNLKTKKGDRNDLGNYTKQVINIALKLHEDNTCMVLPLMKNNRTKKVNSSKNLDNGSKCFIQGNSISSVMNKNNILNIINLLNLVDNSRWYQLAVNNNEQFCVVLNKDIEYKPIFYVKTKNDSNGEEVLVYNCNASDDYKIDYQREVLKGKRLADENDKETVLHLFNTIGFSDDEILHNNSSDEQNDEVIA